MWSTVVRPAVTHCCPRWSNFGQTCNIFSLIMKDSITSHSCDLTYCSQRHNCCPDFPNNFKKFTVWERGGHLPNNTLAASKQLNTVWAKNAYPMLLCVKCTSWVCILNIWISKSDSSFVPITGAPVFAHKKTAKVVHRLCLGLPHICSNQKSRKGLLGAP